MGLSRTSHRPSRRSVRGTLALAVWVSACVALIPPTYAGFPWLFKGHKHALREPCVPEVGEGAWHWMRSPEQERQAVMSLFARYCVRCHGIDGRGVWDIPGVPDFTDTRWQVSRDDGAVARAILEGRGACMPPFRGTMTLEEAWGMARYLRTFVPGTEVSRPDTGRAAPAARATRDERATALPPPTPPPARPGPFAR